MRRQTTCDCESLEREIDDLRALERDREERELERYRREQQEADERRRAALPSNRLYNGDVSDFREAMLLRVAALERQIVALPEDNWERRFNQAMSEAAFAARTCEQEYMAAMKAAEAALIKAWRESGDKDKAEIADCLERGDYSPLAV